MRKLLEKHNLLKLTHDIREKKPINCPILIKIKFIIKNTTTRKTYTDGFTAEALPQNRRQEQTSQFV